jgi:hypothetical protein
MKAIIAGTRYDTEKATFIAEADNLGAGADSTTDFSFWTAALYKTPRSGRYFLAGWGGPRSMFSRSTGQNSWSGGEAIIPLESEQAAFDWAQQELPTDVVEEHFAHLIEDA